MVSCLYAIENKKTQKSQSNDVAPKCFYIGGGELGNPVYCTLSAPPRGDLLPLPIGGGGGGGGGVAIGELAAAVGNGGGGAAF